MTGLSNAEIKKTLDEYEFQASDEVCNSIRVYISLLRRWNRRVSLTTVTSPTETLRFHFGESIFAAPVVPILRGRLADVGSGAGFPGLPLSVVRPEMDLTLIESSSKKSAFMCEVVRELQLDRVHVFRGRMNELSDNESGFDFITARAIGRYRDLLDGLEGVSLRRARSCCGLGMKALNRCPQRPTGNGSSRIRFLCQRTGSF